jgi:hypothetical protein
MIPVALQNKVLRSITAGMTHREVARAFGVSVGAVSSIRNSIPSPVYDKGVLDLTQMFEPTYKVFGFTDMHIPNHDLLATEVAMRAHEAFQPDVTIIGNDFVECTPFTQHPFNKLKEAQAKDFKASTIEPAKAIIDRIQDNTKLTVFQQGNHDAWIERWAARGGVKNQSIYSLVSLEEHFAKDRARFIWMPDYGMPVKLHDKLNCVHGWSYCRHAAGKHLDLTKTKSLVFHHTHRMQLDAAGDYWNGDSIQTMSAGCLCQRKPMYKHDKSPTQWVHGFWVAYIGKDSFTMYPVLIDKGQAVLPCGTEIKV